MKKHIIQSRNTTSNISYFCGVDLAHPNYPREMNSFCVMKKVQGEQPLVVEFFNIKNDGYELEISERLENAKNSLIKKYPGIKFWVDKKYRTWKDEEPTSIYGKEM